MIQEIVGCLSLTVVIPDAAAHAAASGIQGALETSQGFWITARRFPAWRRLGSPDEDSWIARATKVQ
ncbi:MAG: hypothetical protein HYX63_06925 [Gammaproteobacteria bacterium]|nr:hypothetical protein [Gammaproteobacteria bacterium]